MNTYDLKKIRLVYQAADAHGEGSWLDAERLWDFFCEARDRVNREAERNIYSGTSEARNWRD